ncbi:MAG: hypothetical protein HFJ45_10190 [Clostridia bacterium]|nr:hypothetical protein [Clostridia bacterium]
MKRKSKKIIFVLLFILILIYLKFNHKLIDTLSTSISGITNNSTYYKIIKQDKNNNYHGIGQEKVTNQDGYFTTFTTTEDNKKTYKEFKQNGNSSWANHKYWGGNMSENGCGITSLAIILSGYGKNYTPEDLRKKYYPVLNAENISNELQKTFEIENTDFYFDDAHLSKKAISSHLKTNRPILICVWNKPTKNRWTTASHYMILLAIDKNDMVYVSNPNGLDNDSKSSGWYNFDEITPYIAKALYINSY